MSVGNAVGVSVKSGDSVAGICLFVGTAVSVVMVGEVGGGEEQEVRRERKRKDTCTARKCRWER